MPGWAAGELYLDERPAESKEWGYRPADGTISWVNPPSFSWRPQEGFTWEIQFASDDKFENLEYQVENLEFNVHCPPKVFRPGKYTWRYRGWNAEGVCTNWSKSRSFTVSDDAAAMSLPVRDEIISRIPETHPRLFVRPENVSRLVNLAQGSMRNQYDRLVQECAKILADPPPTQEPPKYPPGMIEGSKEWHEVWWGNRKYTIRALNDAVTLGFTRLLGGNEKYGLEARRILMECSRWDPRGSTGYHYNDEAGMPYVYYFSRAYTYVNDLLSEEDKQKCREVMRIRGNDMYRHLCPKHFWKPYSSHSNRAWHFLGEVAIAFYNEIEGADDWLWFAMNVFFNVYPVWSDDDGGWHEGTEYWAAYQGRFTWWADVMFQATGINAYDKPYYSQVGYYAMYLNPPRMVGAGLGDLSSKKMAENNQYIMGFFASQSQNPYWQWYAERVRSREDWQWYGRADGLGSVFDCTGFIRGALAQVEPESPEELPTSRLFKGIGQAFLNSQIINAQDSVQVIFKSSPFGTQSHGYEANNSFLLWGYGKRLLIRSGIRDTYGSEHHRNWMWSTRSVNNITVNGCGQIKHSDKAQGKIVSFKTTPEVDIVSGEAGHAYEEPLERYTRSIVFVKPELVIIYDRLKAEEESIFEYWLHALNEMTIEDQHDITVTNDDVLCDINFLAPTGLEFSQTDQYDPNPRSDITLREWHLTGKTPGKRKQIEFVTLYRIHRQEQDLGEIAELTKNEGGYILNVCVHNGQATILLPIDETSTLKSGNMTTKGKVAVQYKQLDNKTRVIVED